MPQPSRNSLKCCWGDSETSSDGAGVEPFVPHGDRDLCQTHSTGAREMYRIGTAKAMKSREFSSVALHISSELHLSHRRPKDLPLSQRLGDLNGSEVMMAVSGRQSGAHLGICKPTRHRGVACDPQLRRNVSNRNRRSTPLTTLLSHDASNRLFRLWPATIPSDWPG